MPDLGIAYSCKSYTGFQMFLNIFFARNSEHLYIEYKIRIVLYYPDHSLQGIAKFHIK